MNGIRHNPDLPRAAVIRGLVASSDGALLACDGGIVRWAQASRKSRVVLVIGGGSGHFPALSGYVGSGMADGAAIGEVFASPSASQVASVARAADRGAGVMLVYGNYAGDALSFSGAAEMLRAQGTDVRTIAVTDDVASAAAGRRELRRGIAGCLFVNKAVGAACAEGRSLDEVAQVAGAANDSVRSLGLAFSACTIPGDDKPLWSLPDQRWGLGVGLHGEPGIRMVDRADLRGTAEMLVEVLLADCATPVTRAAAVLNGLGSTKSEELFALWDAIENLLESVGVEPVLPVVGEFATSFDMAGCSLSIAALDEDLESLWIADASCPALHRRDASARLAATVHSVADQPLITDDASASIIEPGSRWGASRQVSDALERIARAMQEHEEEFGRLDTVAGDGDHGRAMTRGSAAASAAAASAYAGGLSPARALERAADAWADAAGGASGALWGVILRAVARHLIGNDSVQAGELGDALDQACQDVAAVGGAQLGDKTLLDSLAPLAAEFRASIASGGSVCGGLADAARSAISAAEQTAKLRPLVGRARPLADMSIGHADPGALSLAYAAAAAAGKPR